MGQAVGDPSRSATRTGVRVVGWILLIAGAVILLYVAYLLVYTGRTTAEAQSDMLQRWEADLAGLPEAAVSPPSDAAQAADSDGVAQPEDAYAAMWFERPGATGRPVTDDTLFLVHGVDPETLKQGPATTPTRLRPARPATSPSPATEPPTGRPSSTSTSSSAATRSTSSTVRAVM